MGRIGYGYKRRERDFDGLEIDKLYLDYPGTDRIERHDAIAVAGRPGDVLVLLASGDLGRGREVAMLKDQITKKGMTIELAEQEKSGPTAPPGRPASFEPTKEQRTRLRKMWVNSPYSAGYVYGKLIEMADRIDNDENRSWARNWLNHHLGRRTTVRESQWKIVNISF